MINQANRRPGYAARVSDIRSKPFAPLSTFQFFAPVLYHQFYELKHILCRGLFWMPPPLPFCFAGLRKTRRRGLRCATTVLNHRCSMLDTGYWILDAYRNFRFCAILPLFVPFRYHFVPFYPFLSLFVPVFRRKTRVSLSRKGAKCIWGKELY
jgi:hypothetical protein